MSRLGAVLIVCGLLAASFGVLWQVGAVPGSRVVLPAPVAVGRPTLAPPTRVPTAPPTAAPLPILPPTAAPVEPTPVPSPVENPTPVPSPVDNPTPVAIPTPGAIHLIAADAAERETPVGGYAVRLSIPAIRLDTPVEQAGIVEDAQGEPAWETRPFVAVHYGDLTSLLGKPGNAVIAGHVVTVSEGNVFRFLYQLGPGDGVRVWDQLEREHDYQVAAVRLVAPTDTSVMLPTADETLTLITCGGEFNPRTREFSERLIVTAHPV